MIHRIQLGSQWRQIRSSARPLAVARPDISAVLQEPRFEGKKPPEVFRFSRSVNNRLVRCMYPVLSWMPVVKVPEELRPHTGSAWASHYAFMAAVNRQFSNVVHQGITATIWDHVFDGFGSIKVSQGEQFHPFFESLLLEKLGMLNRIDPGLKPTHVRMSSKEEPRVVHVVDEKARPDLRRLMRDVHDEYREYLAMNPEYNSSFKLRVINNQIVADHIRPSLWE